MLKSIIASTLILVSLNAFSSIDLDAEVWAADKTPQGGGGIAVVFNDDMTTEISIDPNGCSYDDFGQITACTELAIAHRKGQLETIKSKAGLGETNVSLYQLANDKWMSDVRIAITRSNKTHNIIDVRVIRVDETGKALSIDVLQKQEI